MNLRLNTWRPTDENNHHKSRRNIDSANLRKRTGRKQVPRELEAKKPTHPGQEAGLAQLSS